MVFALTVLYFLGKHRGRRVLRSLSIALSERFPASATVVAHKHITRGYTGLLLPVRGQK